MTVPAQVSVDFTLRNVGCRAGYELAPSSAVKNVHCLADGSWTAFPECKS